MTIHNALAQLKKQNDVIFLRAKHNFSLSGTQVRCLEGELKTLSCQKDEGLAIRYSKEHAGEVLVQTYSGNINTTIAQLTSHTEVLPKLANNAPATPSHIIAQLGAGYGIEGPVIIRNDGEWELMINHLRKRYSSEVPDAPIKYPVCTFLREDTINGDVQLNGDHYSPADLQSLSKALDQACKPQVEL